MGVYIAAPPGYFRRRDTGCREEPEALVFDHRTSVLAFLVAVATSGCGEEFSTTGGGSRSSETVAMGGGTSTTDDTTTTEDTTGHQTSTSETTSGEGGASSAGGTAGAGGSGGEPEGFFAACYGTVDCPGAAGCADWEYVIDDDGNTTVVTAGVTLPDPGLMCSDQVQYASSDDAGLQVIGNIMFPCGTQTWAFGTDPVTGLVYVKEMTMGYSWTPACQ